MSHGDATALHHSFQSDIDDIENLINASVQSGPARPPFPAPQPSSRLHPHLLLPLRPLRSSTAALLQQKAAAGSPAAFRGPSFSSGSSREGIAADGFGPPPSTLTEPVWDTVKRDLVRVVTNVEMVVLPIPNREDPGKAIRDWDLWGPFFFIVFLGLILSWLASVRKSISLLGYCLFPLDIGALIYLLGINVIIKMMVVLAMWSWSSWAA